MMIQSMFLLALLPLVVFANEKSGGSALGPYKISDVTVSGISSGGYMAVQVHIAHSSIINGSAVFAGGPYYCAESSLMNAEYKCMKTYSGLPDTAHLVELTKQYATLGKIDKVSHMDNDRVYLFSGTADSVVDPKVVHSLQTYYESFIKPNNMVADFNVQAEHCWPTLSYGEACATLSSPYIGKCSFDGAGSALKTLYGDDLNAPVTANSKNLLSFSQTPYIPDRYSSIGDTGYIYVPTSCADGEKCHLHLAFHGCEQTIADIGNVFAANVHLNEWAESNNIIVLYPYAKSSMSLPSNPNGCWDWWGYTDKNYGIQEGKQIRFVRDLIKAVSGI